MDKTKYAFSLGRGGTMILAGRAAYMPKHADWGVGVARKITLSVYAKVEGVKPISQGQAVRTWDELMDRCEVPADTPQSEQEQRMRFMMEMTSVREGLPYRMREKISTRPPLTGNKLAGLTTSGAIVDDFESALMSQSMMAEYSWQDVNTVQKLYGK